MATKALLTAIVVVPLAAAGCGGGKHRPPARKEYVARIDAICHSYSRKLNVIDPPDLGNLPATAASVARALPILRELADGARAVEPPPADRRLVRRFFASTDASNGALETLGRAAHRGNRAAAAHALVSFLSRREAART